jgi:BlaI family penicillinase repressor
LWRKSPITSSEIIEKLRPDTQWNSKTIHTLISRLVKKGIVEAKRNGTFYQYSALVSEEECRMVETKSFIEKVYDGSLHLLVASFLKNEKLSDDEIKKLKDVLNKMDE